MTIAVLIPSQLTAYTDGVTRVEAAGATVGGVLDDLDRRFPGLKFRVIDEQDRVRKHMRMFIGRAENIATSLPLGMFFRPGAKPAAQATPSHNLSFSRRHCPACPGNPFSFPQKEEIGSPA